MPPDYARHKHGEPHAKTFKDITLGRLDRFEGYLSPALVEDRSNASDVIAMSVWHAPKLSKPSFDEAVKARHWSPLKIGDSFAPAWSNHWVKVTIKVPSEWKAYERVQLEFDPTCEAMIFNTEGLPLQAITGGFGGDRRVEHILDMKARSFTHTLYIEVTCNAMSGLTHMKSDPGYDQTSFKLNSADLVAPRMEAWHLLWDFKVLKDIARELPDSMALQHQALGAANAIVDIYRQDDLSTIAACRKEARKIFGDSLALGADIYKRPSENAAQIAMSNCHIDTAWLWPFSATQQKVARSWSTQIDLMERYPEHRFVASQAQQYKWLEELYPRLFDRVRHKVATGEFQPIGGCWVEMDTNMPSGEALCRQFIFGQRYFRSRFGKLCETFWLPDSFGYASQLPQLARWAGMNHFFTQKLSWSQFNDFPHSTFNWVGIDGTKILTHMPPVNTYTAQATTRDVRVSISAHKSLQQTDVALLPFGNGDGGGGAVAPMLESLRRIRAAADKSRDLPKVSMGQSVEDLFHHIIKTTNNGEDLVDWIGELYLEYHRGTYTSHGSIKNHNRRSEELMRDIELISTVAFLRSCQEEGSKPYRYPKDEIDALWEDVLLCQFHDVLPGSAIEMVYVDAEKIYENVARKGRALFERALAALHPQTSAHRDVIEEPYALNTLGGRRFQIVDVPKSKGVYLSNGYHQQASANGLLFAFEDPGSGVATPIKEAQGLRQVSARQDMKGSIILANESLSVTISSSGRITSIMDIEEARELLDTTSTAGFVIYQDRPNDYDAWDIDIFHLGSAEQLEGEVEISAQGPLRASATLRYKYGNSSIQSIISLDAMPTDQDKLSMLRFENHVDWHSQHVLLKFQLPLAIKADAATYDTQFGVISRPTHRNTSWDAAKFEVCAHKFADLSEFGYGVALINNNKYGYSVAGSTMRLSLLRGATYPDRHQDQGTHHFDFAVYPHRCHFTASDVPAVARHFNTPFKIRQRASTAVELQAIHSPILLCGTPNLVLDTVKRGDDDDFSSKASEQSVVLRFFDSHGGMAKGQVSIDFPVSKAAITDLLEREVHEVKVTRARGPNTRHTFEVRLKPFEVLTVKLWLEPVKTKDSEDRRDVESESEWEEAEL